MAVLLAAALAVVGWSYGHALTAPGTDSLGVKSVEWVRGHGGAGFVSWVESQWYSHHTPPTTGMPKEVDLPHYPAVPPGYYTATAGLPAPKPITPILTTLLAGEGRWTPIGRPVSGAPALYETFVRPDRHHPTVVAGVAWIDTKLLHAELFPGYQVPGGSGWAPSSPITPADGELVGAFNSGFRLQDAAHSGYYSMGRTVAPLVTGYASLVIYRDGTATVGSWGKEITYTPDMASIRQNLPLIVDDGRAVPGLANPHFQRWGATLGNQVYVWRSGVGVSANGALVYAGGPDLSMPTLAQVLVRAGAVRAMELDINTDWVDFFYFDPTGGAAATPADGHKLLPDMVSPTNRYFERSSRDFIALFAGR